MDHDYSMYSHLHTPVSPTEGHQETTIQIDSLHLHQTHKSNLHLQMEVQLAQRGGHRGSYRRGSCHLLIFQMQRSKCGSEDLRVSLTNHRHSNHQEMTGYIAQCSKMHHLTLFGMQVLSRRPWCMALRVLGS